MSQVSRPMQIVLAVTVLFAMVWFVALRPKPAASDGAAAAPVPASTQQAPDAPGVKGLTTAVAKAHAAVKTADGAGAAAAGQAPAPAASKSASTAPPAASAPAGRAHRHGAAKHHRITAAERHAAARLAIARAALRRHKTLAIAFVDSATADGRAVAGEMRHVSRFGGRAVVLSVPLSALSRYAFITREVEVVVAPTVVIVAPSGKATTIVGFADRGEIEQRVADVLARRHK